MEAILESIVRSPRFPRYVDELVEFRQHEAIARARFRRELQDEVREEFINGEVVGHVSTKYRHGGAVRNIGQLAHMFVSTRKLGIIATEQALTEFSRNDYCPDVCFWGVSKSTVIHGDTTIFPVPDFICEVLSPSTEARDRGVKFEDYAAHGVLEYWIVDPDLRVIEQYFAREGKYELAGKFAEGVIRSRAIEGFEMPVAAAFDDGANLEAVKKFLE